MNAAVGVSLPGHRTPVDIPFRADPPPLLGSEMHALASELYPIRRSITGNGVRETLRRLQGLIPLEIHEVPTGTRVFDWEVPREWNIRDAWIRNSRGETVLDLANSSLHVVAYSVPVRKVVARHELLAHVHTLPDRPEWIPYRTSYYRETWGFCMEHSRLERLTDDAYEVCIDSTLAPGALTYGEALIPGEVDDEILVSVHLCHPSLANDNLSGIVVAAYLAKHLTAASPKLTYRLLFVPATIGPITWLARNEDAVARIRHGLVLACVGDAGPTTYKRSRRGDAEIDRAAEHVLGQLAEGHGIEDFTPTGYDERQYCSPGFDLSVGCMMRTPHGRFPEYHTSADDVEFLKADSLADTWAKCLAIFHVLEHNAHYRNLNPKCEPQLGRRGLYESIGGTGFSDRAFTEALLWVLNLSDGSRDLLGVAERSRLPFDLIRSAADALRTVNLLEPVGHRGSGA